MNCEDTFPLLFNICLFIVRVVECRITPRGNRLYRPICVHRSHLNVVVVAYFFFFSLLDVNIFFIIPYFFWRVEMFLSALADVCLNRFFWNFDCTKEIKIPFSLLSVTASQRREIGNEIPRLSVVWSYFSDTTFNADVYLQTSYMPLMSVGSLVLRRWNNSADRICPAILLIALI